MKKSKVRLDKLLVESKLCESRQKAQALIMAGNVLVNGQKVLKPSTLVEKNSNIELVENLKYVSRGGLKLEGALKNWKIDVKDKICLDVGASTGGFTDCLLKSGASLVFAVDVGKNQLHYSLRNHPKVFFVEEFNVKYILEEEYIKNFLEKKPKYKNSLKKLLEHKGKIDFLVMDVSFISVTKLLDKVLKFLKKDGEFLILVKPQFELSYNIVSKYQGIIKDEKLQKEAIEKVKNYLESLGFVKIHDISKSKIKGQDGNQEYFIWGKIK